MADVVAVADCLVAGVNVAGVVAAAVNDFVHAVAADSMVGDAEPADELAVIAAAAAFLDVDWIASPVGVVDSKVVD